MSRGLLHDPEKLTAKMTLICITTISSYPGKRISSLNQAMTSLLHPQMPHVLLGRHAEILFELPLKSTQRHIDQISQELHRQGFMIILLHSGDRRPHFACSFKSTDTGLKRARHTHEAANHALVIDQWRLRCGGPVNQPFASANELYLVD